MRKRHVRNTLDFGDLEDPKIGLPLVESIQRIVIRAEIFGRTLPANRTDETYGKAQSATPSTMPLCTPKPMMRRVNCSSQQEPRGFAALLIRIEINRSSTTVFCVTEKRKPGRTSRTRFRPVMNAQHTADNVLIDLHTESQRDLMSNPGTTPAGITPFCCHDGLDEVFVGSLRCR
jgi:hypothetical protein